MLERDKTLILFGRSPFINDISQYIPTLCQKYHTMGCNYFCDSFPQVEYVIFFDDLVPKVCPHHTIITNIEYAQNRNAECYELLNSHPQCELYKIVRLYAFSQKPGELHMCIHTPSLGLNWAYLKGFKNVVLAGIDLTLQNILHFDKDTTPDADSHDFNQSAIIHARLHLEKIASAYLNIFQLNPDSDIKIPKITISDLL